MVGDRRARLRRGGVSLALLVAAGCAGGDPGPMSGELVLPGRDLDNLTFWQPRTLRFTRNAADPSMGAQDLFVWPLDEPAPSLALAGVDWEAPDPQPRAGAGELLVTGTRLERVYDVGTRQEANLAPGMPLPPPDGGAPDEEPDIGLFGSVAFRSDGRALAKVQADGARTVIVGRPPDLRAFTVPDGGRIGAMAFVGADLALLVRQISVDGDVVGVQRLDTSSGAFTPLVPATPAGEWTGITGFCGDLFGTRLCGRFRTVGCDLDEPPCPDGRPPSCRLVYGKYDAAPAGPDDASARAVGYVHDFGAGTTAPLDGEAFDTVFYNRGHHLLVWGARQAPTRYENVCTGARGQCEISPTNLIAWRPDGAGFAMFGNEQVLSTVDIAAATCGHPTDLNAAYSVLQAQFAPGSDRLLWVAGSVFDESPRTLWLADRDGNAPVALLTAPNMNARFSGDGRRIYASHLDVSTVALGWFDVAGSPPTEHILSTNHEEGARLGNRRALFIDHYNFQDGNGEMALADVETGTRQLLARAVTAITLSGGVDGEAAVAYAARGRGASSRDGLWLTTLPP
jgi:hypothetical protein